jgi:hypothetical protein
MTTINKFRGYLGFVLLVLMMLYQNCSMRGFESPQTHSQRESATDPDLPGTPATPEAKINSVDSVVNDMLKPNDYPPFGRNPGSCQYEGACLVMGNLCGPAAFTPENPYYASQLGSWMDQQTIEWLKSLNWVSIKQWGQLYQSEYGHASGYKGNSVVQIRNMRIYQKRKSTGKWFLINYSPEPAGAFYTSNFDDPQSFPERIRKEASGGLSVVLPEGEGY